MAAGNEFHAIAALYLKEFLKIFVFGLQTTKLLFDVERRFL